MITDKVISSFSFCISVWRPSWIWPFLHKQLNYKQFHFIPWPHKHGDRHQNQHCILIIDKVMNVFSFPYFCMAVILNFVICRKLLKGESSTSTQILLCRSQPIIIRKEKNLNPQNEVRWILGVWLPDYLASSNIKLNFYLFPRWFLFGPFHNMLLASNWLWQTLH